MEMGDIYRQNCYFNLKEEEEIVIQGTTKVRRVLLHCVNRKCMLQAEEGVVNF